MKNNKSNNLYKNKYHELEDAMLFNTLFEGLAEGAGLDAKEARRAMAVLFIHNTADFIINRLLQYFFAADQLRGFLLERNLLLNIDFLRKATALRKSNVIDDQLFKSLAKLNDIRVAIAHGKEKNDPRLKYMGKNILSAPAKLLSELDDTTVGKLLKIIEKIRRIRIAKDKWPEKPFIYELYDKDRK